MQERYVSRRELFAVAKRISVGIAVAEASIPVLDGFSSVVQSTTGVDTGNASSTERKKNACREAQDPHRCVTDYQYSTTEQLQGIVVAPILEESQFRALPSFVLDLADKTIEGDRPEQAIKNVFMGTRGKSLSRRELIVGGVSSVIFGSVHNITDKGFDSHTLPAYQTAAGMIFWYLQRKLGVVSNTVAHMWNNARAMI